MKRRPGSLGFLVTSIFFSFIFECQQTLASESITKEEQGEISGSTSSVTEESPNVRIIQLKQVIKFPEGKAALDAVAMRQLDEVFVTLVQYPKLNLIVWGTADEIGGELPNLYLSQLRAKAVAAYLFSKRYNGGKQLARHRIKAAGSGEYDSGKGPEYMTVRFYIDGGYFIVENGVPPPVCGSKEAEALCC